MLTNTACKRSKTCETDPAAFPSQHETRWAYQHRSGVTGGVDRRAPPEGRLGVVTQTRHPVRRSTSASFGVR